MSFRLVDEVLRDVDLDGIQKLVLAVLASYADEDGSSVYPAVRRVAREAGVSERTAQRKLRELERAGIIWMQMPENHRLGYTRNWVIDIDAAPRLPGRPRRERTEEARSLSPWYEAQRKAGAVALSKPQ